MDSNRHGQYTSLMSECLDGVASQDDQMRLVAHLDSCGACAALWEEWLAVDRLLGTAPAAVPSRSLAEGVSQRLRDSATCKPRCSLLTVSVALVWAMGLAASCMALAWFLWWAWLHPVTLASVLSVGAQTLSGVSWALTGIGTTMKSIVGPSFAPVLAPCVVGVGSLAILWIRGLGRSGHLGVSCPSVPL